MATLAVGTAETLVFRPSRVILSASTDTSVTQLPNPRSWSRRQSWTTRRVWFPLGLLAVTVAAVQAGRARHDLPSVMRERFIPGRLASTTAWHPCHVVDSTGSVPRSLCGDSLVPGSEAFDRVVAATTLVRSRTAHEATANGRHVRALAELRWYRETPLALDRTEAQLDAARRSTPEDPRLLNDIAVVYMALAERDQTVLPLLRALDVVERGLHIDSLFAPALFNRALVMERLSLVASSRRAWRHYITIAPHDDWSDEARQHEAALARMVAGETPRFVAAASDTSLTTALRSAAHHTRELGMRALGEWGRAVGRGDTAAASAIVAMTRASLNADLAHRDDTTDPAFEVATRPALSPAQQRAFADAYVLLSDGQRLFASAAWDKAVDPLVRARKALAALHSPLMNWAALYCGASQLNLGFYGEADSTLSVVAADTTAEPEVVSRAILALGVSQVRRSNFERANDLYATARSFLARVHDRETVGYGAYLRSEGFDRAGQARASQDAALYALHVLAPIRQSNYLNNQLTEVAAVARDAGLRWAALTVMNEVLEVAAAVAKPETIALAYSRRARDQYAVGDSAAGVADLDSARVWADRMRQGRGFERIRAAIKLTTGELRRPFAPASARILLDSAVETFRQFENDLYLPAALYESALAADAMGDKAGTRARLDEALTAVERMQGAFRGTGGRAVFADRVERISDRAIRLALEDGHMAEAFAYLERARTAVLPVLAMRSAGAKEDTPALSRLAGVLRDSETFVEYALLDDRLIIWEASKTGVGARTVIVRRDTIAALVGRLKTELRSPAVPDSSAAAARLFELLLRPIEAELHGAGRLIIVPDRELHSVPFAALWDVSRRQFVAEQAEVREVPSGSFLLAASHRHRSVGHGARALIIGDPILARSDSALLGRLPGAAAEARDVAALYPSRTLLIGAAARRDSALAEMKRADVIHFAGHAVFNADRPELSYLALGTVGSDPGRLNAREISDLRLSNTSVVVLSACSTLNPRPTRAGAAAGIAYSFLNAGVPATISTLWDVSDVGSTAFLVELHRALADGGDGGAALRRAQLQAIHSSNLLLRTPFTWAAFTFTGHD